MNCPKCDEDMDHVEYDPDVGIMRGYYFCTRCDIDLPDDEDDSAFEP